MVCARVHFHLGTRVEWLGVFLDGDVIVVMDCGSFVAFVKNGNVSIVGKGSNTEERIGGQCM